jgi:ribosomal protein L32
MSILIEEIEIILVILALVVVVFILYKSYRKVKIARMGPPKRRMTYSEKATKDEKPRTSQVIGMIKCEYCGALMAQTAISCPNCGATRKK